MLVPVRTIPPSQNPVSLEEAKAQCNVDHDDDDDLIEGLIDAATDRVDGYGKYLGRALIDQEWSFSLRNWPCDKIRLPIAPVSQVVSVTYWDDETVSAEQPYDDASYSLLEDVQGPYLIFNSDAELPSLASRDDAITVHFVAGYGSEPEDVPASIRRAILMTVSFWYDNRDAVNVGNIVTEVPLTATTIFDQFRRLGV